MEGIQPGQLPCRRVLEAAAASLPGLGSREMVVTTRFPATDVGGGLAGWARLFAQYPGPRIIAAALVVVTTARVALWRWHWWDVVIVAGFVVAQPFTEWLIHVFILHFKPRAVAGRTFDPFISRKHRLHHLDPRDVPLIFIPLPTLFGMLVGGGVVLALAFRSAEGSLTAGVIALSERQSVLSVWRTNYAWMPLNFLATAAQGAALALASQALGVFGVLVFTLPLAVAWYSFRLYMSKSSEVRQRNAELQSVNEMLRRTNDRLEESHLSVIGALIGALEAKENSRAVAAARTMALSVATAERLSCSEDEIAAIKLGALFHDIGTIGVPETVLRKPGALDDREWQEVRAHSSIGANLLSNVPMLERVRPIVLSHHERYDGSGYPQGLREDQIPLAAQIIAVADAFAAMTEGRPYRLAMSQPDAVHELRANAGTQFNPVVVEAFIAILSHERKGAAHESAQIFQQALEAVRVRAS